MNTCLKTRKLEAKDYEYCMFGSGRCSGTGNLGGICEGKRHCRVGEDNQRGTGTAVYKGQEWTARASEDGKRYEAGTIVKVKEIRGVTMYVTESGLMPQVPTTPQTEQEAE